MADTTIEVTGDEPEDHAEETITDSVAEAARNEGAASQSAEQASNEAEKAEANADVAADAAQASMTAAQVAQSNAAQITAQQEYTAGAISRLEATVERLASSLEAVLNPPTQDVPPVEEPNVLEVDATPDEKRGHWLTRKLGVKK